jgi:hypothetical protein
MFRSEEFTASPRGTVTIIFVCPYGTSIEAVRWAIRRLLKAGYNVLAYAATKDVFLAADPAILPDLIREMRADIRSQVARLRSEGVTEFGFFGSSLGSFIFYNCVGDQVPELRWGVFNTGGDIAKGMWRLEEARRQHVQAGWSLDRLSAAWAAVQYPEFGNLDGGRFIFVSSRHDKIAPLAGIEPFLGPMREAGARVSVQEVPAIGHFTTIVAGLWQAPRFVALVRSGPPLARAEAGGVAEAGRGGADEDGGAAGGNGEPPAGPVVVGQVAGAQAEGDEPALAGRESHVGVALELLGRFLRGLGRGEVELEGGRA